MSEAGASRYSIGANLRWFAAVYGVVTVALAAAVTAAALYGVNVPSAGASIGAFAGVVLAAGQRFATKRRDWTARDRHQLALGYVAVSIVVSAALAAAALAFDPATRAQLAQAFSVGALFIVGVTLVMALVFYGLARFMLALTAKRSGS